MKRTFIIIATLIALIGIGVAIYFTLFNKNPGVVVTPSSDTTLPTSGDTTQTTDTSTTDTISPSPTPVSARLVKISAGPVVPGEVVVDKRAESASSSPDVLVSYLERQSGNIYSYSVGAGTLTRTSNKTVPGIQSAAWLPDGTLAFVRYLSGDAFSTINTYALPATGDGKGGFFLSQGLSDIGVSSTSLLMLSSGVNGSVASLARTDGSGASEIFTTPLSALHVSFAGKNQYLAYTKPSATLPGVAFLVDNKGGISRVAGPLNGLVAKASPSGKWVLVSFSTDGVLGMLSLIHI
jgi:hypothetical protein